MVGPKTQLLIMKLLSYVEQLAHKLQSSWELSEILFNRHWADSAPSEVTRRSHRNILKNIHEGHHDFRRNYRVKESGDNYNVIWDDNTSGAVRIHCVVNKRTGDVGRFSTDLINEAFFQFNLLDSRSREECLAVAEHTGEYLR